MADKGPISPEPQAARHGFRVWPSDESMRHICKSAERVIISAFTTRNTVPFGLLVTLCVIACRLPGEAIERLIIRIVESNWFAVLGWALLGLGLILGRSLFVWREKLHAAELAQVTKVRDRLVEEQLKLKLDSPPLTLDSNSK